MKKTVYLILTFLACYIFGAWKIWVGFVLPFCTISFFKIEDSFLWEIPLAVLSCNVLELAFGGDAKILLWILVLFSTFLISVVSAKRLLIFFVIVAVAMLYENTFSVAAIWAMLWYGVRSTLGHFITKETPLQEYKS